MSCVGSVIGRYVLALVVDYGDDGEVQASPLYDFLRFLLDCGFSLAGWGLWPVGKGFTLAHELCTM